jgi:hypothetical protein
MSALYKMDFVGDVFEVGMIALKEASWIACSPDGIALIRVASIGFSGCVPDEEALASVEIKTSVSEISSSVTAQNASADVITCELGDVTFHKHVPEAHMAQVIQQMVVLSTLFAIYLCATETGVMFVLVIRASETFLDMWKRALLSVSTPLLQWAYTSVIGSAPDFADAKTKQLLELGVKFWRLVNANVMEHGPFPPVKGFKHGIQNLYSKTKGGVDGSAQARAIMRSTTISPQWEQKLVTKTFKTLAVNSFVAYRLQLKADILRSREEFRSISAFRASINSIQSLSDFIYDVSPDLLSHADKLQKESREGMILNTSEGAGQDSISNVDLARLSARALSRKRRRMQYFNDDEGRILRLSSIPHIPNQTSNPLYCALCGCSKTQQAHDTAPNNSSAKKPSFRGRRSTFKCSLCHVHLCVRTYPGLRKSCWDLFHSNRQLIPRITPPPSRS